MPRSHLVQMIKRAFNAARIAAKVDSSDKKDVIHSLYDSGISRRKFIGSSLKSAALAGIGGSIFFESCSKDDSNNPVKSTGAPPIAIIGAGIAGLNCAYQLHKAGCSANIYEASTRHSGRMYSIKDAVAPGIVSDSGGEFVDSNHYHILNLATEFGIDIIDRKDSITNGLDKDVYFFNNFSYTEADVIAALVPVAPVIQADIDALPDVITADNPGTAIQFDNISLEQYIAALSCAAWLKELLIVAYVTEYGRDAGDQSCINMLFLLSVDTSNGFNIFGSSNERYKIAGGSQRIPDKIAGVLHDNIHYEHRLVQVSRNSNNAYVLSFERPGSAVREVTARVVVFALPFTLLREVTFTFALPAWKRSAINTLGYGTNAKLIAGFDNRYWQSYNKTGDTFSDESYQSGWDGSELQSPPGGAYTFFLGGTRGIQLGTGTEQSQYADLITGLEKVFPGIGAHHNGNVKRFHWPTYPFTKASYSCYKPGQWTTIAGNERKTVDALYFCGEHCSLNFQGFMNGGAETGYKTAQKILAEVCN